MTVQAAIQYWCIAAPIACLLSIFVSVPIGGMIGYNVSFDQYNRLVGDVFSNFFWGGFWGAALSLVAAGTAYSMTRPIVRVVVDKDYVRFGSYKFDRRFASGMRIGYSSDDVELSKTVTQPRFGVTVLRFGYGPWGEDMKYMVNAHYASDICNWMNEVIDSVGAPKPKENDAQEGRKLELL
ncbi:hypothetical protein PGA2_c11740 [Phaeobacter inhibens 2.10]|nr:hypothetical protein PGA2_c11740 [Phaeobacter inhibens 2.10]